MVIERSVYNDGDEVEGRPLGIDEASPYLKPNENKKKNSKTRR